MPPTDARYARQTALPGFPLAAQRRLLDASVALVGVGGLGCPALAYLAGAGVGRIRIIDSDTVARCDLARQTIFREDQVGQSKAAAAAAWVAALNRGVAVDAAAVRLGPTSAAALLSGVQLVLDCSDNFGTRYTLNDYCLAAAVPYVWAAVDAYEGRVGAVAAGRGPCLRCLFGPPEAVAAAANGGGCAVSGAYGPICGTAGALQAGEAVKLLTGLGAPLTGRVACLDGLEGGFDVIGLERDPACAACGVTTRQKNEY
jgi:adenylyltransferase/sulfurtransferase